MLSTGLAGFVALPKPFFPFPSISFSFELSRLVHLLWSISQSGSIRLHDGQHEWALLFPQKTKLPVTSRSPLALYISFQNEVAA